MGSPVNPLKKHIFRPVTALLEGLLGPLEGGWTLDFSESPTGPLGGGVGPWTFKKSESIYKGGVQSDAPIRHTLYHTLFSPFFALKVLLNVFQHVGKTSHDMIYSNL